MHKLKKQDKIKKSSEFFVVCAGQRQQRRKGKQH